MRLALRSTICGCGFRLNVARDLRPLTTPYLLLRDLSSVTERVSFCQTISSVEFCFLEMATIGTKRRYEEDIESDEETNMSWEDAEELELDIDRGRLSKGT